MATLQATAQEIYVSDCDHNWDEDADGVIRCVYCRIPKPICQHNRIDCYNDDDEYIGWHCLDCGEPVSPPLAVSDVDDLPF